MQATHRYFGDSCRLLRVHKSIVEQELPRTEPRPIRVEHLLASPVADVAPQGGPLRIGVVRQARIFPRTAAVVEPIRPRDKAQGEGGPVLALKGLQGPAASTQQTSNKDHRGGMNHTAT